MALSALISLKIRQSRPNASGKFTIYISIAFKKDVRYIATPFEVSDPSHFDGGRIVTRGTSATNKNLSALLDEYRARLTRLDLRRFATCSQLKDALTGTESEPLTVSQMFTNRIAQMEREGRQSYVIMLKYSAKVICDIIGNPQVCSLTRHDVRRLLDEMRARGYASGNIQMRLTHFKAAVNDLIDREQVRFDVHPFRGIKIPQSAPKYTDISRADFQRIKNLVPDCKRVEIGRNLWLLSFYLCGLNLVDLTRLGKVLTEPVLRFERQKTSGHTRTACPVAFTIPSEARPLIIWAEQNGIFKERTQTEYKSLQRYANRCISLVGERVGIRGSFSYYSARHTFAQFGLMAGVHLELIEHLLGHSVKTSRPVFNYLHIMQPQADAAIRKIIDYTNNPENYEL